jgi:hypothetical protein
MRLIDADAVKEALRNRISENIDECINNVPTVCDIEQLSATRYNNGFYDGAKGMTEKWNGRIEQIRAEIERLHYHPKLDFIKNDEVVGMALDIIDKYK